VAVGAAENGSVGTSSAARAPKRARATNTRRL
jgi:hypothetical protein